MSRKLHALLAFSLFAICITTARAQIDPNQSADASVQLGVNALNGGDYKLAIRYFEDAVKKDPKHPLAKDDLGIAYNNYGLQLRSNPEAALQAFHKALWINANNAITQKNCDKCIASMGKDPASFDDRVALARQAQLQHDTIGATVEFNAALKIKDDPAIRKELAKLRADSKSEDTQR